MLARVSGRPARLSDERASIEFDGAILEHTSKATDFGDPIGDI